MKSIDDLLAVADAYKAAAGVDEDVTVSYRVFGDSKKLGRLRGGFDITTRRYDAAFAWFSAHWPEGKKRPDALVRFMRDFRAAKTKGEPMARPQSA